MYCGTDFPLANPDEGLPYSFNFVKDLATGETISSAVWTLTAYEGTDAGASSHLIGSPSNSGQISTQFVSGLLDGVVYRIHCLVTTSANNVVGLHSFITCKQPLDTNT